MSLLGTLLRPKRVPIASKIAICSAMMSDWSAQERGRLGTRVAEHGDGDSFGGGRLQRGRKSRVERYEDIFIRSLVKASSCRRCADSIRPASGVRRQSRTRGSQQRSYSTALKRERFFSTTIRERQTAAVASPAEEPDAQITREEYRDLVNTYESPSELWEQPAHTLPAHRPPASRVPPEHFPLAPRLAITPQQEDQPPNATRAILPPQDESHAKQIRALKKFLRNKPGYYVKRVWRLYQHLPTPRVRYLDDDVIRKLFRHLAWVEWRDLESLQRYFALVHECNAEHVPLIPAEWNTAISFAGRWLNKRATSEEVKASIETWMLMEDSGAQATNVTFNILFDVAVRAGRFALADTIYSELKARDLPLNRYFRTSMIYYAGMRRDGDAVRQAFRELVNAGEMVDTAVMNCVILSLVRAGEAASAENVYAKMKHLHETKFGTAGPKNWREGKVLGKELDRAARYLRKERDDHEASFFGGSRSTDERREKAQQAAPIHPDSRTCQILIMYHAYYSGDLDRVRDLFAEMKKSSRSRGTGTVYVYLLRGFWIHGGHAYTAWNRSSLEYFWAEFLQVVRPLPPEAGSFSEEDEEEAGAELFQEDDKPYFSALLAERAVHAFYKCAGQKRMLEVWAQIQECWGGMSGGERTVVEECVLRLVREDI